MKTHDDLRSISLLDVPHFSIVQSAEILDGEIDRMPFGQMIFEVIQLFDLNVFRLIVLCSRERCRQPIRRELYRFRTGDQGDTFHLGWRFDDHFAKTKKVADLKRVHGWWHRQRNEETWWKARM